MRYTSAEILTIRKSLFLTQVQFAKLLETHLTMVARWEQGKFRPSEKWCEKIRNKIKDVKYRVDVLNQLYREKKESYFVLFDSDLVDYSAKQIMFAQKVRSGYECHLVKFNRKSYENYTNLDHLASKPLNDWAKWYHSHGEKKPLKRKPEYPWLTEWEA